MTTAILDAPGVIDPTAAYTLAELKRRTGMGAAALREARRKPQNPLRVRYCGRRAFVIGRDWIDYIEQHGEDKHYAG